MMTKTYSIDTGDGNQLCAGLQGHDYARQVAQRRADELGQSVYLYAPSEVAEAEERGEEHESEEIEPTTVRCECGDCSGVRCSWVGDVGDTVVVEWMPPYLRASHEAAGNSGVYPHNGAERLIVAASCAEWMSETEAGWIQIVESDTPEAAGGLTGVATDLGEEA